MRVAMTQNLTCARIEVSEYECGHQEKSPTPIMILCSIPFEVLTLGFKRLNNEGTRNQL
jgi:hypothetical protein